MRRIQSVNCFVILAAFVLLDAGVAIAQQAASPARIDPQASLYAVDGLALGGRVRFDSAAYRDYECDPSDQFDSFTWCKRKSTARGSHGVVTSSNSILHSQDSRAVYINRAVAPAYFDRDEFDRVIQNLSNRFGEKARVLKVSERRDLPDAVIASWGKVKLAPLDPDSISTLASGGSVTKGILIDFLGDWERSAKQGLPIYRLLGGAGYVWAASRDNAGRGHVRFLTIDASAFMPQVARPQVPTPATPGTDGEAPAPQRPAEQAISSGTGFFVSAEGHVLTNNHVVEDCSTVKIERPGFGTTNAIIVARDKSNDLALLRSSEKPTDVPTFRLQLKRGETIFVFGFPLTGFLSSTGNFAAGTVTALTGLRDDSGLVQISASVYPGNSGGPLIDRYGNVGGVIVGRIATLQNVNFAIKSSIAVNFLASNRVTPMDGATSRELPSEEIAELANSFTVRVLCTTGTPASPEIGQRPTQNTEPRQGAGGPYVAAPPERAAAPPPRSQFNHYVAHLDPNGWNWLAFRSAPDASAQWSTTIQLGPDTPVKVLDQSGEFSRVQLRSGEVGWVNRPISRLLSK